MKHTVTVSAPAKLNLYLDVVGKRGDGYHNIESVMQSIELCDIVTVTVDTEEKSDRVTITCTDPSIPCGKDNICVKAVSEFYKYYGDEHYGVDIHIEKNIPVGAGMGGGSADAAAVAVAMNRALNTFLDSEELCNIAANIGADVPFCVVGKTQYCTETGDMLRQLSHIPDCIFVVGKGSESVSTAEAYKDIDNAEKLMTEDVAAVFCSDDINIIAENCRNIFEQTVKLPEVNEIKDIIAKSGALCSCMTGSGSAVFGIFTDGDSAAACEGTLKNMGYYAAKAMPSRMGVRVLSAESAE